MRLGPFLPERALQGRGWNRITKSVVRQGFDTMCVCARARVCVCVLYVYVYQRYRHRCRCRYKYKGVERYIRSIRQVSEASQASWPGATRPLACFLDFEPYLGCSGLLLRSLNLVTVLRNDIVHNISLLQYKSGSWNRTVLKPSSLEKKEISRNFPRPHIPTFWSTVW